MSNTNVTRTANASVMQTAQYISKGLKILPNSTLNQKLNIHADVQPTSEDRIGVRFVAIGRGGHAFTMGANGRVKYLARHHTPRHNALYDQVPFVLRRIDDDLTATERLRYRLRRKETHHGEQYYAYYLRVLDTTNTEVELELRHVEDGVTTSTPYEPTLEDLNPVPPQLVAGEAVTTTGDYIASTAKIPFVMSPEDVEEFVNACRIIDNEDGYAIISEMATVSGVDRTLQGDFGGTQQAYTDTVYAQITSHIATAWIMEYQTDGITMTIDVGNVEPLLVTAVV